MGNSDKKVTIGNIKAFFDALKTRFMPLQTPQELRSAMGLGDTLGPLGVEYGGTGKADLEDAVSPYTPTRNITYNGIGASEFSGNSSIVAFEDKAAPSIGEKAFQGSALLKRVSFPACATVGASAFADCTALTDVSLPACTTIGSAAFEDCEALEEVSLSACVEVGYSALSSCGSLVSVELPSCKTSGYSLLSSCTALESVRLPALEAVPSGMLYYCKSLRYVKLGGTSTSLALYSASSLPSYSSFPIYPAADGAEVAVDLHGVKSISRGASYGGYLCYGSGWTARIWVDGDVAAGSSGVFLSYGAMTVHVYTDGSSLPLSSSNFYNSTVKYHYNQDYDTWLATYGA